MAKVGDSSSAIPTLTAFALGTEVSLPTSSLPTEVTAPTPPIEKMEVEKRKKKSIAKRVRSWKNFGESSDNNVDPDQASFDCWRVVRPLVEHCIVLDVIEKILWMDAQERKKDSFMAFLEVIAFFVSYSVGCIRFLVVTCTLLLEVGVPSFC